MSKLPPITQALADAITEAQERADVARAAGNPSVDNGGLAPIGTRRVVHETYQGADPDALHVELVGGPAARALYMAFVHAGADVPTSIVHADVILSAGRMDIICQTSGTCPASWNANVGVGEPGPLELPPASARQWSWSRG